MSDQIELKYLQLKQPNVTKIINNQLFENSGEPKCEYSK